MPAPSAKGNYSEYTWCFQCGAHAEREDFAARIYPSQMERERAFVTSLAKPIKGSRTKVVGLFWTPRGRTTSSSLTRRPEMKTPVKGRGGHKTNTILTPTNYSALQQAQVCLLVQLLPWGFYSKSDSLTQFFFVFRVKNMIVLKAEDRLSILTLMTVFCQLVAITCFFHSLSKQFFIVFAWILI